MTQNFVTASSRVVRALVPLMTALAAGPVWADLIDLNVNDPNGPACAPGATNSAEFLSTAAINEQILALTAPSGANVFWELGFNDSASNARCTPTPATGFATSYACSNGVSIALPPGATETTSAASTEPVAVLSFLSPMQGNTTANFSLTATLDGGSFPSCQNFYEIEVEED